MATIFGVVATIVTAIFVVLDLFAPLYHYGTIRKYCDKYSVEPSLVLSVIWTESKFRPRAVSGAGAVGLMQLLPSTAEYVASMLGVEFDEDKLYEPEYNIMLGTKYLAYLGERFEGDYVLAAYNAGEGRVSKWDGSIPLRETAKYVKTVKFMRKLYTIRGA